MANFPPPPGLTGYQKGQWWSHGYYRHCTADEAAVLEADRTAALAARRAADENGRAAYFAQIAAEVRLPPAGREGSAECETGGRVSAGRPDQLNSRSDLS